MPRLPPGWRLRGPSVSFLNLLVVKTRHPPAAAGLSSSLFETPFRISESRRSFPNSHPARLLPDMPYIRPTYETHVGQTQTIDKHSFFTICPTARHIFKKKCFKGEFHTISASQPRPQPPPAPHSANNTRFSLYTPKNMSGMSGSRADLKKMAVFRHSGQRKTSTQCRAEVGQKSGASAYCVSEASPVVNIADVTM